MREFRALAYECFSDKIHVNLLSPFRYVTANHDKITRGAASV